VNPWRERLYASLVDQPQPIFTCGTTTVPSASIWTGSQRWIRALRAAGIEAGDVIALQLKPSPVFVQVLVAALCNDNVIAIGESAPCYAHVVIDDAMATSVNGPRFSLTRNQSNRSLGLCEVPRFVFCAAGPPVAWQDRDIDGWIDFLGSASSVRDAVFVADSEWRNAGTIVRNTLTPIFLGAAHVIIPSSPADRRVLARQHSASLIRV
jgi:hypothetical protein